MEIVDRLRALQRGRLRAPEYSVQFFSEGYSVFRYSIMANPSPQQEPHLAAFWAALHATLKQHGIAIVVTFDGGGSSVDGAAGCP